MRQVAIYGKGGIGKSTTTQNLTAGLGEMGKKIMIVGCDPKADSTRNLTYGKPIPTVLESLRNIGDGNLTLKDLVFESESGVLCVEAGGPMPGVGCAGRGIITAFEKLEELNAYEYYKPDVVLYDVLGDVVCGGFSMPIRGGYADEVCIVTSGEMMSLYAASNISYAVKNFGKMGYASLKGLIFNAKNFEGEKELVEKASEEIGTKILYSVPRDSTVQQAEAMGMTVVQAFPNSKMSKEYFNLANIVYGNNINE